MNLRDSAWESWTRGVRSLREPFRGRAPRIGGARSADRHGRHHAGQHPHRPRAERHRTIFISDTHLGTRGCKAAFLADFLRHNDCDTLYLVGDIVDGWRLKRRHYWNPDHDGVIAEILHKAQNGTRVIYVPGNHDEVLRDYVGLNLAGVELHYETVHTLADGRRLLVIHGDHFDGVVRYAKWLAHLGDWAYTAALMANDGLNGLRRRLGLPYWSLSGYLKRQVKNAVEYISNYEKAVVREVRARGLDGVVCGHIHQADIKDLDGILYCNDGDWVESCTALVENHAGNLAIVHWAHVAARVSAGHQEQAAA